MTELTDKERQSFRELAEEGLTKVTSDEDILRFYAWCEELNKEAVRLGLDPDWWPMDDRIYRGGCCWLEDFEKGLTPAEALSTSTDYATQPCPVCAAKVTAPSKHHKPFETDAENSAWLHGHEEGWNDCLHEWNEQITLDRHKVVIDRSAVWQSGGNSVHEEIDCRDTRVRYRRATDQLSWFTAGHIFRKFEARTYDIGKERRIVLTITGDVKEGEISPPEGERDWTEITAQEAITLREARQLGWWLIWRTAPPSIRKLRLWLRLDNPMS